MPSVQRSKIAEKLVPPSAGRVLVAPQKVVWLYFVVGSACSMVFFPPSLSACAVAAGLTVLTLCAGHSVGLHRGIIHHAYACPAWLRGALVYLFVHTGIGGPLSWIRLHHVRDYYQNQATCPRYFGYQHSAARDFWWNLHLRFEPRDAAPYAIPDATFPFACGNGLVPLRVAG